MTNFGYKQINNILVDSSEYTPVFTHVIEIPRKILFLEKHFLPFFYRHRYMRGIYVIGRKKPILSDLINYINRDKTLLTIKDINDLDIIFEDTDTIFTDTYHKVLTKKEFYNSRMLLTEQCSYPLFTEDFLDMVISSYMRKINTEKDLVDADTFGYSEHIHLLKDEYMNMDLNDFFAMHGVSDTMQYKELLENYELLYMDIISICKKFNPLSIKIEINNNLIKLMFYDSPSSRRYNINKIISSTDDISMYEDF